MLFLVASCFLFLAPFTRVDASVIIIGAGISGLGAARRLLEAGVDDFIILEARNVVGGRMQGFPFGGYELQQGAFLVSGTGTDSSGGINPMWEFAQEIGLDGSHTGGGGCSYYDSNGNSIVPGQVNRYWNAMERAMTDAAEFAGTLDPNLDSSYNISQQDVFDMLGYQTGQTGPELWTSNAVTWMDFDWGEALKPSGVSTRGITPWMTGALWGSASWYTRGGFGRIPEYIASKFMNKILFNNAVLQIEYSAGGVAVTTQTGVRYTADQVISTVSAAVLKSSLITWNPPLPVDKRDTLDKFSATAVYNKLFLQFETVFWDTSSYIMYMSQERGDHAGITNMNHPNYEPGSRILKFEQVEDQARRWEQESLEQSVDRAMGVLRSIYGANIPNPANSTKVMWGIDPFFQMSFSTWGVNFSVNDYNTMCAPVDNVVFFGGEACSQEFYGYTHGGYIRGIAAAEELLDSIGMLKQSKLNPIWCRACEHAPKGTYVRKSKSSSHF